MSRICGIDPGLGGAIAWIDGSQAWVVDMPVGGNRVDGTALADIITGINPDVVVIEDTQPMPKNGSIASFSLGLSTGTAIGVAASLRYPIVRIKPAEWKKRSGLIGKDKSASLLLARELWPTLQSQLTRKKDADRAEALLIARAWRTHMIHEANA